MCACRLLRARRRRRRRCERTLWRRVWENRCVFFLFLHRRPDYWHTIFIIKHIFVYPRRPRYPRRRRFALTGDPRRFDPTARLRVWTGLWKIRLDGLSNIRLKPWKDTPSIFFGGGSDKQIQTTIRCSKPHRMWSSTRESCTSKGKKQKSWD